MTVCDVCAVAGDAPVRRRRWMLFLLVLVIVYGDAVLECFFLCFYFWKKLFRRFCFDMIVVKMLTAASQCTSDVTYKSASIM